MNEPAVQPQHAGNVAKRMVVGMIAGGVVTAVVVATTVEGAGEGPVNLLARVLVGFVRWPNLQQVAWGVVAGIILGSVGGMTGRVVRGMVAGLVVGAILIGISAFLHPAIGVAGELRSFDTSSINGEIAAGIYGMVVGAIGGGVGGASGRLVGPKTPTGSSV
jgi:hypothetical protein